MSTKASMPAMIYRRGLGQLKAVLPRGCRSGRCAYFGAVMVARTGVLVEGLGVAWPLVLAVTAARPLYPLYVFGEYGCSERGGVEHGLLVKALRDARSL
jgi:hypothetical protein